MGQRQSDNLSGRLKRWLFVLICLAGTVIFYKSIICDSPLNWTFEQDHYWESLYEIPILVIFLFAVLFFVKRNWVRWLLAVMLILTFAYLHAFFYAFIVGALYALMIWMTGRLLWSLIAKRWEDDFLACFFMGMAGLIVLVAICSVLKFGTPDKLRVIYLLAFTMELYYYRDILYGKIKEFFNTPSAALKERGVHTLFSESLIIAVAISAFMIQVGRANIALDYDSGWYGVRSESVLAPYTGIYDQLMMTGCVYVYSKGIEVLSLAFSFDTTYSFVYAVNLMFAAVMLYAVYKTTRLICKRESALFAVLCCSVTAGIMNMASTAKSDISTLLLQIIVLYFGMKSIQEKSGSALMMAVAVSLFSIVFKPSSIVFTSMLLAAFLVAAIINKIKIRSIDWRVLPIPVIAVILLLARTYLLTGIPLTSFGKDLWASLGMMYEYPYESGMGSDYMISFSELFTVPVFLQRVIHFIKFLFRPVTSELDHVIIAWHGILFSVVWLAIVFRVFLHPIRTFKRMRENSAYAVSLIALALISVTSMGCIVLMSKPDGNYFMLMYAMTFIHGEAELSFIKEKEASHYRLALAPLIICGILTCVASHWSWALGFTPIELENKGAYNHAQVNEDYYESIQIDQITSALSQKEMPARVMIFSSDIPKILSIPAVADSWLDLEHWGNASIAYSTDQLYAYYCAADVEYLLVDMDYVQGWALPADHLISLAENGYLRVEIKQGNHCLVKFLPEAGDVDYKLIELLQMNSGS